MTATGWCEDCGDVEVEPMCVDSVFSHVEELSPDDQLIYPDRCCHYADCPTCGNDVDQWAWA